MSAGRPSCCIPGWSGSCGGTCDAAVAEQEAAERDEERYARYDRVYGDESPLGAGTFGFLSESE